MKKIKSLTKRDMGIDNEYEPTRKEELIAYIIYLGLVYLKRQLEKISVPERDLTIRFEVLIEITLN